MEKAEKVIWDPANKQSQNCNDDFCLPLII